MADLASGLAASLLQKLGSVVYEELFLAWGVQSDLQKLESTISDINIHELLDAEYKQASNPMLRSWLGKLKVILSDAKDVIDEIEYKALRKQAIRAYGTTSSKVRHFFSSSMALSSRLKLAHKIKDIRERLDKINAGKDQFNLTERREEVHVMPLRREMTHSGVESSVIGRHWDKEKIIEPLMNANRNVNVISIVGLGGLGKTTLAKSVYNDETVINCFQLKMWVCLSTDFRVTKLMEKILKSAGRKTSLRELLKDKRFLLILDDVWNENRNKWVELIDLLNGGSHGSVVVVTTCSHKVSSILDPIYAHSLNGLSKEECLSLFVKCAFKEGEDKRHPNLLPIADEIVEKCKGVPLAVKSLGGYFIQKLMKDHEFSNLFLIEQWVAHGMILRMPANKKQDWKDVGNLYIKELTSICFFQDFEIYSHDGYFFRMHDLVHDFVLSIAQGEWLEVDSENKEIAPTVCHLSISYNGALQDSKFPNKLTIEACISRFKSLRVLDLNDSKLENLPSSIGTQKHLKYLDLSNNESIKKLPNSIFKLYNLQTLIADDFNLERLPKDIRNLINLRFLAITTKDTCLLKNGVCCFNSLRILTMNRCLTNLCTLVCVECKNLTSLLLIIKHLTALKSLYIINCEKMDLMGGRGGDVQYLNLRLQILYIVQLPKLEVLLGWLLGFANTLRSLHIEKCGNLKALPEWLPTLKLLQTL
ncbi:hypothetical protein I3842_10G095900, partial [Carya illinoinensis]